jgi:hypothetical protein
MVLSVEGIKEGGKKGELGRTQKSREAERRKEIFY